MEIRLKAWTDSQLLRLPIDQKLNEVDLRQALYAGGIQADLVVAEGNGWLTDMREELARVYPEFCVNVLRECKQQKLV